MQGRISVQPDRAFAAPENHAHKDQEQVLFPQITAEQQPGNAIVCHIGPGQHHHRHQILHQHRTVHGKGGDQQGIQSGQAQNLVPQGHPLNVGLSRQRVHQVNPVRGQKAMQGLHRDIPRGCHGRHTIYIDGLEQHRQQEYAGQQKTAALLGQYPKALPVFVPGNCHHRQSQYTQYSQAYAPQHQQTTQRQMPKGSQQMQYLRQTDAAQAAGNPGICHMHQVGSLSAQYGPDPRPDQPGPHGQQKP